ncbi:replication region DNA-binding N-term [Paraburkholderia fungorum]|uniref:Replication region DNA-binding N-term n=1 Tax=Paraburkholderia fungorum TaxID=134537 RepID=A0A1H1BZW6_9BURK|nr:DNA-binding protein [Paraburkholderia fungorum]SDQ57431.1 replication region DNA-binding N-term [Paraburkholderia fungorum]
MTLESDIEAVREHASDTQALYREVCALMFFRYGETPTANRLYQLVRKGSMSAPAKALRDFWVEVREKTRVDVGRPDLPAEVAAAAGELAANLWRLSSDAANAGLDVFRQDVQAELAAARERLLDAESQRDEAASKAERAADNAVALGQQIGGLEARLVELQTANDMLTKQLALSKEEIAAGAVALADARRDFADELTKLRQSHEQNEQRLAAAEKRALLEIESERAAASRMRKELQAANERTALLEAEHRSERDALRDALATTKAELAASAARCLASDAQIVEKDALLAERLSASDLLRQRVEIVSQQLEAARAGAAHGRPHPHLVRRSRVKGDAQNRASIDFSGGPFVKRPASQKP